MLGKIIKHELKLSFMELAILSVGLIVASFICPLLIKASIPVITTIGILLYIILFVGVFLYTIIIMYRVFYKSMFDNEGYLTNIVPVKASTMVFGKFFAVVILTLVAYITIAFSLTFFFSMLFGWPAIGDFLSIININILSEISEYVLIIILYLIMIFISLLTSISMFFMASALFNTFRTRRFKVLIIFALWLLLSNTLGQIPGIPMAVMLAVGVHTETTAILLTNIGLLITIILNVGLIIGTLYYAIHVLEKKVDIE